ncbi:hypothetical protein F383_34549 [Gossypium arboreum]|uniref:Uncharacterized protein n=1 Tax=Gossypium arboreum TaxID=29729 RepID=A0A0B0N4E9_GOSAR|nr:hypothetical protein F383_34549 [Gossypium arboreum]
MYTAVYPLVLK